MSHGMDNNKLEKHYWIWPIAWYLFLGGLGGGILFVAGIYDVVSGGQGHILALGVFAAVVFLGVGSFLLVFELGQPFVFLRVFLSGTAIIKYGACLLVLAMGFGFIWFLFQLPPDWHWFYYGWTWIRDICMVGMIICGLCIMVYTGVLLSTMKSKPFWNTPALPVLFTVSALSTATALLALTAGMWPAFDVVAATPQMVAFASASSAAADPAVFAMFDEQRHHALELLHTCDMVLIIAEIVVLLVYVIGSFASGNVTAKQVANEWIRGKKAVLFWGGMICIGLTIPFLFYVMGGVAAALIAPVLVLAGGLLLRFMIVYSDKRRPIPGEERFYRRLPKGKEEFFNPWKAPYEGNKTTTVSEDAQ